MSRQAGAAALKAGGPCAFGANCQQESAGGALPLKTI